MLLTAGKRERVNLRGQDVVGGFGRQWLFDERVLGEGQAVCSLECDSAGAEPIFVKIFAGNNLSIKHAAPK